MKAKIQHEIQEYCSLLRLNAISEHFEEAIKNATDYEGFLHQLLRMEVDAEEERAKERKIKAAKFPYRKYIEDLEMDLLPEAMRRRLPELCSLDFIRESKNIIMTGNPGTGKTHTAIGLGIKACEQGYRVLYTTIPYLVTELKESNSQQKLAYSDENGHLIHFYPYTGTGAIWTGNPFYSGHPFRTLWTPAQCDFWQIYLPS